MEFDININLLFRDVITKVDSRLQPCRNSDISYAEARKQLFEIINKMGEASAKAQALTGSITSGRRLESSDHHLYIMKDTEGSRGKGAVIGILRMGRKRLFVYDHNGQQWEMNPMCVLDFYVHESRQRTGCGRRLFDFMLQSENMVPKHLAVDRPSLKFLSFLAKHYGLRTEIPQVNNFVIFQGFFINRPTDGDFIQNRRNVSGIQPADLPCNDAVHSNNKSSSSRGHPTNPKQAHHHHHHHPHHPQSAYPSLPSSRPSSGAHMRLQAAGRPSVLSRNQQHHHHHHQQQQQQQQQQQRQQNTLKDLNLNPRPPQPLAQSGNTTPKGLSDTDLRSMSDGSSGGSGNARNRTSNLQLQSAMYSRHQAVTSPSAQRLTPTNNNRHLKSQSATVLHGRDMNGSAGNRTDAPLKREKSPPAMPRDGPPRGYLDQFNLHHNYQGRAGHLVLNQPSKPTAPASAGSPLGVENKPPPLALDNNPSGHSAHRQQPGAGRGGYYTNPALHHDSNSSWTVFGVMRRQNNLISANHSGRTRLW